MSNTITDLPRLRSRDGRLDGMAWCTTCDCGTLHAFHRVYDVYTCAVCDTVLHCDYCCSPVHVGQDGGECEPCGVTYV